MESIMTDKMTKQEDLASLYRRAFAEYGPRALWNMRPVAKPSTGDALAITQALRTHGSMDGRRLAERIEEREAAVPDASEAEGSKPAADEGPPPSPRK